ncbi:hypothetical protein LO762_25530 [Actinocorallia sp. API 0066]|uniref:hypothetical protein n=1 Tax=Actinocorallia sp. API 0066 TaxID=2896846 RepID=UPI001E648507|nr:hypothetical protein [Actinocorallia sp. API 0066]MCD0452521.1 hypothetical protein [Actinocorallia sp. API 0066]
MRIFAVPVGIALIAGGLAFAPPAYAAVGTAITIRVDEAPKYIGDSVTVSGKLTRTGGAALPSRDILVNVAGKRTIVRTNTQGLYIAELVVPRSGAYTAEYLGDTAYDESTRATPYYPVHYRTGIDEFTASPKPVAQNKPVNIAGRAFRVGLKGKEALTGASVDLHFSGDGKNWSYVGTSALDAKGRFRFAPTVAQDGTWYVVLEANPTPDGWTRTQRSVWIDSRYPTRLSVAATPKNVKKNAKVRLHGALGHRVDGVWRPLGKVRVTVYFKPKGGKWRSQGTAWVSANGKYSKKFKTPRDGWWRTVYQGNGANFKVTSKNVWVNVL